MHANGFGVWKSLSFSRTFGPRAISANGFAVWKMASAFSRTFGPRIDIKLVMEILAPAPETYGPSPGNPSKIGVTSSGIMLVRPQNGEAPHQTLYSIDRARACHSKSVPLFSQLERLVFNTFRFRKRPTFFVFCRRSGHHYK